MITPKSRAGVDAAVRCLTEANTSLKKRVAELEEILTSTLEVIGGLRSYFLAEYEKHTKELEILQEYTRIISSENEDLL